MTTGSEGVGVKGSPIVCNLHFGNKTLKYNALLDSGSDVSLLEMSVFNKIDKKHVVQVWKDKSVSLHSASNHDIKSHGKVLVHMFINGTRYNITFVLTSGFKFEVLIGSDFIYEQKAKLDFESNTMIIGKRIICLRSKYNLPTCSLLEVTSYQHIEPYSVTHIRVRSKQVTPKHKQDTCMITPLDNSMLFYEQPGLVAPSVAVNKNISGYYTMPVINNTGVRHSVKKRMIVGFIESVDLTCKNRDEVNKISYENNSNNLLQSSAGVGYNKYTSENKSTCTLGNVHVPVETYNNTRAPNIGHADVCTCDTHDGYTHACAIHTCSHAHDRACRCESCMTNNMLTYRYRNDSTCNYMHDGPCLRAHDDTHTRVDLVRHSDSNTCTCKQNTYTCRYKQDSSLHSNCWHTSNSSLPHSCVTTNGLKNNSMYNNANTTYQHTLNGTSGSSSLCTDDYTPAQLDINYDLVYNGVDNTHAYNGNKRNKMYASGTSSLHSTQYSVNNVDESNKASFNIGAHISGPECQKLMEILKIYNNLFVDDVRSLRQTNILEATFNTGNCQPVKQRPYKNPLAYESDLNKQINDMLEAGIISPSSSPWSSPIVIVPKKDGSNRVCVDYRKLNQLMVKDSYPLPRIEDIFATLGQSKYFTSLDLKSGYHNIAVAPQDREKTAFCTRTALYQYNVLPFGLSVSGAIFSRMISKVLHSIEGKFAMAYLDDILIFSKTFEEHLEHIKEVFIRLEKANLCLNKKKCHFVKQEIEYLGHLIGPNGIKPNPEKVRVIQTLAPPVNVRGVRSFIGMVSYYRNFIPRFSEIARPLTNLTRKHVKFEWNDDAQQAFDFLKKKLTEAPILGYPDVRKPYSLYTDASDYCVGGILTQDTPDGEKVIQYVSHQLTPNRLHYPVIQKECFAIVYCLTKLRQYLLGADVTVYTDHKPLKSLFTAEMKNTRIQRWAILLDEYQVKIKYRQGIHNCRADFLSRICVEPTANENKESNDILAVEKLPTYDDLSFDDDIDMRALQRRDKHCKEILKQLRNDENEKVANDYVVQDRLLYHIGKVNRYEPEPILQLVIPNVLKQIVLEGYHSELGGGHVGLEKTYQKIRSKYFWPHCYKDTVEVVQSCDICQRRMLRKRNAELQDNISANSPMEVVGIDTVGPFVTSTKENNYIVTVVDWYSSWVEAYPIPDKEATTIAEVLLGRFIPQHGCPRVLISDRGAEYVNTIIDELSTKMKIKRHITSPYAPSSNGKTERCHRFLNDIIAKGLQGKPHDEWEEMLPAALFAMRTCVNESTKYTPYMLLYGRDCVLPLDTVLTPRRRYYGEDYVPTMFQRLHAAFLHVADNTKHARAEVKRQADKRARQRQFVVGDPVYLHDPVVKEGQVRKFKSPWKPYYRIVEMVSPVTAIIRCQKDGQSRSAHVNNLRYANINGEWDLEDSPDDTEEEEVFPEQNTRRWLGPRKRPTSKKKGRTLQARVGLDGTYPEVPAQSSDSDTIVEEQPEVGAAVPSRTVEKKDSGDSDSMVSNEVQGTETPQEALDAPMKSNSNK